MKTHSDVPFLPLGSAVNPPKNNSMLVNKLSKLCIFVIVICFLVYIIGTTTSPIIPGKRQMSYLESGFIGFLKISSLNSMQARSVFLVSFFLRMILHGCADSESFKCIWANTMFPPHFSVWQCTLTIRKRAKRRVESWEGKEMKWPNHLL